ncbi:GSCFA domain-containing protein [Kordiimonas lacus]|uniref:GSCFA family protein n=1 Tax=Kordiimonas lacus TaxID=637679 RepID=A0A1G6Y2M2_9PROT|nr:GSCFA domain-containing protein [Kordiimonas lacus]SDD84552.1 GSCFA family protein [Kordiimonas lacus]
MKSPYQGLPRRNFWRTGVADEAPETIQNLYRHKFKIGRKDKVATAGSCFAQHIARNLRGRGFNVLDMEPGPPGLSDEQLKKYGFSLYSARFGNIYAVRQLLRLAQEAFGEFKPRKWIWERNGRFFDALRPSVEPEGLSTPEQVRLSRMMHLSHVRRMFEEMDVFVFTLGLTEAWENEESGTVYPTALGTIAGSYDPQFMSFKNYTHSQILEDFLAFRALIHKHNADVRFLLTVSPVPLTATATTDHVLTATTYSKSALRGVAGELYQTYDDIDYFPSYEIIASPFSKGKFFAPNLRSVTEEGVQTVMRVFFDDHDPDGQQKTKQSGGKPTGTASETRVKKEDQEGKEICEDALLEAFSS